jgi:hypothetical protein
MVKNLGGILCGSPTSESPFTYNVIHTTYIKNHLYHGLSTRDYRIPASQDFDNISSLELSFQNSNYKYNEKKKLPYGPPIK